MSPNGKSAPSLSLAPPLESQDVSRYPAVNTSPDYFGEKAPPLRWRVFAAVLVVAIIAGLTIVAPFAMDWAQPWKFLVAVPVFLLGVVAVRWIR